MLLSNDLKQKSTYNVPVMGLTYGQANDF